MLSGDKMVFRFYTQNLTVEHWLSYDPDKEGSLKFSERLDASDYEPLLASGYKPLDDKHVERILRDTIMVVFEYGQR